MAAISTLLAVGSAVAGIGSAAIGANATKKAAKAQTDAATANNALQERIYNENRNLLAPDIAAGRDASSLLSDFLGVSGDGARAQTALDTFLKSTGYQEAASRGTGTLLGLDVLDHQPALAPGGALDLRHHAELRLHAAE